MSGDETISNIGAGFHAALRKRCDSFATSQAYGLIRLTTFGWRWFAGQLDEHREWIEQIPRDWRETHHDDRFEGFWAERFQHIVEYQIMKALAPANLEEWLDGEPVKRREKKREADTLWLLTYCFAEFADAEIRGCLEWAGLITEDPDDE